MNAPLTGTRLGWAAFDFTAGLACGTYGVFLHLCASGPRTPAGTPDVLLYGLLFGCCLAIFSCLSHFHQARRHPNALGEFLLLFKDVTLSALITFGMATIGSRDGMSASLLAREIGWTLGILASSRILWRRRRIRCWKDGTAVRNFAVVGSGEAARGIRDYLTSLRSAGYLFKCLISLDDTKRVPEVAREQITVSNADAMTLARSMFVDEIFFMVRPSAPALAVLLKEARCAGIDLKLVAGISETLEANPEVNYIGALPTISLYRAEPREISKFFKRLLDIVGASCALVALSPLFLVFALLIKLDSPGPVFYVSERVGLKGRVFRCIKFRTMVQNAQQLRSQLDHLNERDGVLFKIANDPRMTGAGAVFRKYSLDELPQFWNVIRGDMSLVGPRPPLRAEVEQYTVDQFCRLEVMPGITGLWQVEARHDPSFESYIQFDRTYVRDWTIWLDLKILFRTLTVVARGTGS